MMTKHTNSGWILAIFITLLLLAAGLRFYKLDSQSFWNDEGNSARLSERSIELIIAGTASDIHPPLYYLMLRGWRELLGEHEFGLRSFSAFAGILVVAATAKLGKILFTTKSQKRNGEGVLPWALLSLAAVFWTAVNPALIYYSQETRMYSLLALLAVLSTLFMFLWLRSRRWLWAVVYVVTAVAGLYTHYFFPAILIVQNLYLLIWLGQGRRLRSLTPQMLRKTILTWIGIMAAVFLLYLPWLPIFLRQVGGRPAMRSPLPIFLWDSLRWLAFGETISVDTFVWPTLAVLVLLLMGLLTAGRVTLIMLLATAVPILFMYFSGTTQPAFFKFLVTAVPFYCLWLAAAWAKPGWRKWQTGVALLLVVPLLLGTGQSLYNLYFRSDFARADYRGMAARIAADNHPNAGIILDAPNQWEVFTYYHQAGAPVYPLPLGQPDPAIVEPELAEIAADHDRIYAIFWGAEQRDPERVVEGWLDANAFKATDEWVGDVRFVVYALPHAAVEMATAVSTQFGDHIILTGFTLAADSYSAGDIVGVTLFWETAVALDQRYKVFLHLLDANGNLVAQSDSEPSGGSQATSAWQPSQSINDNHGILLPADLPPGDYQLVVGLYDIADPDNRLPIQSLDNGSHTLSLGIITVR